MSFTSLANNRNPTFDILRRMAIFTMVAANFSAELLQQALWYRPFLTLGRASLFMYILHQVVLVYVLLPFPALHGQPLPWFLLTYALTISLMIGIGHGLAIAKRRYRKLPFLLRFVLGS